LSIIEEYKVKTGNLVIYPVILSVPDSAKELTRRARVKYLSRPGGLLKYLLKKAVLNSKSS